MSTNLQQNIVLLMRNYGEKNKSWKLLSQLEIKMVCFYGTLLIIMWSKLIVYMLSCIDPAEREMKRKIPFLEKYSIIKKKKEYLIHKFIIYLFSGWELFQGDSKPMTVKIIHVSLIVFLFSFSFPFTSFRFVSMSIDKNIFFFVVVDQDK